MSILIMVILVIVTFLFGDSVLTPILLLLWKKIWLLLLKVQALFTKKNIIQVLVQSLLLAAKALLRLINKTITVWILPLLLTRRQRYWLHHAVLDARKSLRRRILRGWVRWRRQALWFKVLTVGPAIMLTIAFFIGSGILLAGLFGVTFIVPWIGGLPLAAIVFFRRALARLGLFVLERLGVGTMVNKTVDWLIDLIWWKTPEPVQRRFDVWWRRFKMRLRRWVIGPRRQVTKRMARFRRPKPDRSTETLITAEEPNIGPGEADVTSLPERPKVKNATDQARSADP
ncbi:MAG: hypothetical protein ACR2QH_07630 [Geminicoccaceae bacterium]